MQPTAVMKITFLLPRSGHQPIGGFKVVYEYANALVGRGHEVTVIHAPPSLPDDATGTVRILGLLLKYCSRMLGFKGGFRPEGWFRIDPRVRMKWTPTLHPRWIPDADIVIASAWQTAEWLAGYAAGKGRKFYLIQGLESCYAGALERRVMASWRLPLKKIVISRWLQRIAEEMNEEALYIPNGLDFTAFELDNPVRMRDPHHVVMLYHDKEFKGSRDGLAALSLARGCDPALTATLFGVPDVPDGLPSWITYEQLPKQVRLRQIYNEAALFVGSSWVEGWGLTAAEAAQCGAALCLTDIGGYREFATPDVTALMTPPRDCEALAANILRLIRDDELRVRLAVTAHKAIHRFTWARAVDLLEQSIAGLTGGDYDADGETESTPVESGATMTGQNPDFICLDRNHATTRRLVVADSLGEVDGLTPNCSAGGLRRRGLAKRSFPGRPLISVVTVVSNGEGHLERTIRSVLQQSYDNVEYILIDGCSSDGTVDVIKGYDGLLDYWVSEPDSGIYDAMNKGARVANGDWLVFLNSGDLMLDVLQKVSGYLNQESGIYYGDVYMPHRHKLYDGKFSSYDLMKRSIPHPATFYPKRVFAEYSYDLRYRIAADYHLNIRCFNDKTFRFVYLPLLVAIYEDTGGISAIGLDLEFQKDFEQILRDNFPPSEYLKFRVRRALWRFEKNVLRKLFRRVIGK